MVSLTVGNRGKRSASVEEAVAAAFRQGVGKRRSACTKYCNVRLVTSPFQTVVVTYWP